MSIDPTFDPSQLVAPPQGTRWVSFDALEPGDVVCELVSAGRSDHANGPVLHPGGVEMEGFQVGRRGELVERGSYDAFFQRTYGRESGIDGAGWWVRWEDGSESVLHSQIHVLPQTPEESEMSVGLPPGFGVRGVVRTVLAPAE